MKILLVGVHFFSSFAWSVKRALERLGHDVVEFDYRSSPVAKIPLVRTLYYRRVMQKKLLRAVELSAPGLIVICKGELILGSTIALLHGRYGIPIINWFPDARLYSYEEVVKSIPFLEGLYTKNHEDIRRAKLLSLPNIRFLAHCADVELHNRAAGETNSCFQSDLAFVGSYYLYRDLTLSELTDFDLKVWGQGWKNSKLYEIKPESVIGREARSFDQGKVFFNSLININTHHFDDVRGLNQRLFDICGSAGFQIVDYKDEIAHYYEIGQELETFSSIEELRSKIHFYLKNKERAREIGLKAQTTTMRRHTYDHRVRFILNQLSSTKVAH